MGTTRLPVTSSKAAPPVAQIEDSSESPRELRAVTVAPLFVQLFVIWFLT